MKVEQALAELIHKIERHFYGKYRGLVVDNRDPKQLGRLKLKVPSVLGSDVVTGWAWPCLPYGGADNQGMVFIPEVDAGVWVEFEEGDLEFPIWVGGFWSQPDSQVEVPRPNEADGSERDSVADPMASRKIIKTLKGHSIQFEDKDGEEMLLIVQQVNKDEGKSNVITLDANGITIDDHNDNVITLDANGITINDCNDNQLVMSESEYKISTAGKFSVTANEVEITASAINLKKS